MMRRLLSLRRWRLSLASLDLLRHLRKASRALERLLLPIMKLMLFMRSRCTLYNKANRTLCRTVVFKLMYGYDNQSYMSKEKGPCYTLYDKMHYTLRKAAVFNPGRLFKPL